MGCYMRSTMKTSRRVSTCSPLPGLRIAYAVKCARLGDKHPRENDQDPSYKAIRSVRDATTTKAGREVTNHEHFRIVVPLIVTDADMFECSLTDTGELRLQPTDEMAVLVPTPDSAPVLNSLVYIIREPKLPEFIARMEQAHERFHEDEELLVKVLRDAEDSSV